MISNIDTINSSNKKLPKVKINSTFVKNPELNSQYVQPSISKPLKSSKMSPTMPKADKQIPITLLDEDVSFKRVARKFPPAPVRFPFLIFSS